MSNAASGLTRPPSGPTTVAYRSISLLAMLRGLDAPTRRRVVLWWAIASLVFIPSGIATRLLEWTGIPFAIGDVDFFITVYVPMLFCTLCVIWLGYAWGAIPAYLSTFCVALLGGMPLHWIILFSFANPLGLAVFALAYRTIPIRTDLRSLAAFLFFTMTAFVAAIVGSSGSFVWAYTNQVGVNDLMAVWQGWWLGGFIQTMLFIAPVLLIFGPVLEQWKAKQGLGNPITDSFSRGRLQVAFAVVLSALTGYVILVRYFSLARLNAALTEIAALDGSLTEPVSDAFTGLSLIHWVTLLLIATTGIFGYQAMIYWTASLRASRNALSHLNNQLTEEIDERKRVETELQEQAALLERANDSKDRFFSVISHDLRSPLASVLAMSQTLTDDFDDFDRDTLRNFLALLHRSAENLFALLNNLLSWSRLQTGDMAHHPEWLDLDALIASTCDLLRPSTLAKDIHLRINVPSSLHTWADPNMIRSVVLNLLSNAIKFTHSGGAVILTVSVTPERLSVEVRDTGIGMTEDQRTRLFDVATTFSTTGTADEKGSGLGLILCKEMLAHHGSDLIVNSFPSVGTSFFFTLPSSQPLAKPLASTPTTTAKPSPI